MDVGCSMQSASHAGFAETHRMLEALLELRISLLVT